MMEMNIGKRMLLMSSWILIAVCIGCNKAEPEPTSTNETGNLEGLGKKVDKGLAEVGNKIEKAVDSSKEGLEKAGKAIETIVDTSKETLDKTVDAVVEKTKGWPPQSLVLR